ncbi:MAG: hypothetical protein ACI9WS_000244 [Paraglaciecola psychrophila]|jgi:hypothetical protein
MSDALTLQQRFARLDGSLLRNRQFWQLRSFESLQLPWQHSALQRWLLDLSANDRSGLLHGDQLRAEALVPFIPDAVDLLALCQLPSTGVTAVATAPTTPPAAPPAWLHQHIPGRKWAQIQAFDRALIAPVALPFVEWCAGKGHLGRLLAYRHRQPVASLELQRDLCLQGQQLADKQDLPCRHHQLDVMSTDVDALLPPQCHAVALHACGDLHIRLLQQVVVAGVEAISLCPCCYHLQQHSNYQPLSEVAAASGLRLSRADLSLAVQQTVTAGSRGRRLRQRQLHWRLAFDLLQRQLRGVDSYLNCPTIPQSRLTGSFAEFCQWMAGIKELHIPTGVDFDDFEHRGRLRLAQLECIEIIQQLFRRPLELWLVLDRALYLQQHGYTVTVTAFCESQLTPRNLLITGRRL